jgi:hypothetical protein
MTLSLRKSIFSVTLSKWGVVFTLRAYASDFPSVRTWKKERVESNLARYSGGFYPNSNASGVMLKFTQVEPCSRWRVTTRLTLDPRTWHAQTCSQAARWDFTFTSGIVKWISPDHFPSFQPLFQSTLSDWFPSFVSSIATFPFQAITNLQVACYQFLSSSLLHSYYKAFIQIVRPWWFEVAQL